MWQIGDVVRIASEYVTVRLTQTGVVQLLRVLMHLGVIDRTNSTVGVRELRALLQQTILRARSLLFSKSRLFVKVKNAKFNRRG